jgi:hypothetical protein
MIVKKDVSPLWLQLPADTEARVRRALEAGVAAAGGRAALHFRADDVAVVGAKLVRMFGVFAKRRAPVAPALVPAWLTAPRFKVLRSIAPGGTFAWHQHGWRHLNHEPEGKKCEFGPARDTEAKADDIRRGAQRLAEVTGGACLPVFTPPWNRMDADTLDALPELGFRAVSRTPGAKPACPACMAELPVHAALHSRREADPEASLDALAEEMTSGLATGVCGVMLHHQRMNQAALDFLDMLLDVARRTAGIEFTHLGELAA